MIVQIAEHFRDVIGALCAARKTVLNVIFAEARATACETFIDKARRRVLLNSLSVVARRVLSCQKMVSE